MMDFKIGDVLTRVYDTNANFIKGKHYRIYGVDKDKVIVVGERGVRCNIYKSIVFENFKLFEVEEKKMNKVKEFTILEVVSVDKFEWDRAFNNDNNWYEVKLKVRTVDGNEKVVDKLFTCCEWDRIKRMGAFYSV